MRYEPSLPLALALALTLLLPAAATAGGLSLFASQWDTSDAGESLGFGAALGIPLGSHLDLDLRASRHDGFEGAEAARLFPADSDIVPGDLEATPIEVGLRWDLGRGRGFNPYLGAGASYFLLDSTGGEVEVDDEVGFYGTLGARLGDGRGADLFVEGVYRQVEATVARDPEALGDVDDLDLEDEVEIDLGGVALQAGLIWSW